LFSNFPWEKRAVGWHEPDALSVAFHADDGRKFSPADSAFSGISSWNNPLPAGKTTLGCGINFETNEIFFTRDGVFMGIAYRHEEVKCSANALEALKNDGWIPCITFRSTPMEVSFNFGQRCFEFNLVGSTILWDCFGSGATHAMHHLSGLYGETEVLPFETI
jgi:Ran-binding protein 9/10